jgi:tetratricopeptide (TPR) repeat protein
LNVEAEQEHLQQALTAPISDGRVELVWLAQASWDGVLDRLLTERWHVLHFIGHGDYDDDSDEGQLALVGDGGRADWVEASRLADLLDEAEPTPRLVLLNSCSSGQGGAQDLFSGTAATLVRRGIAAVAAMQFSISDRAAVAFPKGFYTALVAGRGVDEAVKSGRKMILGARGTLEWVTPVLYVRGNATRLFTLTNPPPATTTPPPAQKDVLAKAPVDGTDHGAWSDEPLARPDVAVELAGLYQEGVSALFTERYTDAVDRFHEVAARDPNYRDLQTKLDRAERLAWLDGRYQRATAAASAGDWPTAVAMYDECSHADGTFRDVTTRLAHAKEQLEIAATVEEIRRAHSADDWLTVLRSAERLADQAPGFDPDGLIADARQRQQSTEQDRRLAADYDAALDHLDRDDVDNAAARLRAVAAIDPAYRDTRALLARCGTRLAATVQVALDTAQALLEGNKFADAIGVYDQVTARFNDVPELRAPVAQALVSKGGALGELGRTDEAIGVYDQVISRFGDDPALALRERVAKALVNKGIALGQLGRYEQAVEVCDDVVARFGDDPAPALREPVAMALVNKGITLGQLGRYEQAVGVYDDLMARFGDDPAPAVREQVAKARRHRRIAKVQRWSAKSRR